MFQKRGTLGKSSLISFSLPSLQWYYRPKATCEGDRFEVIPFEDCSESGSGSKGRKLSSSKGAKTSRCDEFTQEDEKCFLSRNVLGIPQGNACIFPINDINNCGDESIVRKLGSKSAKSTQSYD